MSEKLINNHLYIIILQEIPHNSWLPAKQHTGSFR